VIGESAGHGGREQDFPFAFLCFGRSPAQLMMGPAPIVGAAHQPHPGFEPGHSTGGMPAPPGETGQALAKSGIQAFDKRRI